MESVENEVNLNVKFQVFKDDSRDPLYLLCIGKLVQLSEGLDLILLGVFHHHFV